ncbi:DUF4079 domain-containing protein [Synechococcus elongatus]|uniref:DUF4079 domain-containing protein n=2 Tax=Synechococcus elongatus TaxID=32046 RepID=A0AAN1QLE2_SYNEL|nr:DUF4079 domain-containing protein [Synechococcus elongatus]AZB71516.1 DUF4079 domain-containing protein [Synechococcus elongatus PCC 11801]QFZ91084.1 DUF4079 domain-containing protein [Synechococcus elongatus PCC 11802]
MKFLDWWAILHPAIAVVVIYPILGVVLRQAWLTRQRRLSPSDAKSKIPVSVGQEHSQAGRWLTTGVVIVSLLGIGYPIFSKFVEVGAAEFTGGTARLVALILAWVGSLVAIATLFLIRPKTPRDLRLPRALFAILTGFGVVALGQQPEVFKRDYEALVSHYYYGIILVLLMIFALATLPEIQRFPRWRILHIVLNIAAAALFLGQGVTGARDLLEIPLSWQKPTIYQCDFQNLVCPGQPPT